jgi:hypothetical protein
VLLWTHDEHGHARQDLPTRAKAYLGAHLAELQARKDFRGGTPWTLFRARPALARYRVVWADLSRSLVALALTSPSDRQQIPLNSCYVAPTSSAVAAERIAAWLNSTWIRALARLSAVPAAGGFRRFNARVIGCLPLPTGILADERLSRVTADARAGGVVQEELDDIVAQHLGLSNAIQCALRPVVDGSDAHRR